MHLFKPQMNSAGFNAALREAGFNVDHGRIVDVSGSCPGFATLASFNKGAVNRNATLTKVIRERDIEIARRAATAARPVRSVAVEQGGLGKKPPAEHEGIEDALLEVMARRDEIWFRSSKRHRLASRQDRSWGSRE